MAETFEEKRQLAQEHFAGAVSEKSDETTPEALTDIVEKFAMSLGGLPQFVPVIQDQYGLFGWCSDGVLEKVRSYGGGIRFGWTIWEWPKILLTAEFHAVWISSAGSLIDITPKPQRETRIVFVPDDSYAADFDFDSRPTNRRFRIPQEPDYRALAEAEISKMKISRFEYEKMRAAKKGLSLVDRVAAKQPRAALPLLVDELIQVCDAVDRKTDELAGTANRFQPDREYSELFMRKLILMHEVKLAAAKSS